MRRFIRALALSAFALCGLLPFESAAQISNPTFTPDLSWCSTQGSIATRKASSWNCLLPGASGQVLQSGGAGADTSWLTVTGTGTVTSVAQTVPTFMSVTGSPITGAGTLALSFNSQTAANFFAAPTGSAGAPTFRTFALGDLPTMASQSILANVTGGVAVPTATTLTAIMDGALGSTQGQIAYRNAAGWVALATGTSGQFLQTAGVGGNPSWQPVTGATGGTVTSVAVTTSTGIATTANPITLSGTLSGVAMVGSNGVAAGTMGMVPTPAIADNVKFLRGDGTWQASASSIVPDIQVLTVSGTYTTPASTRALHIRGVGAGGGGGGATAAGGTGGASTWAALLTANGGVGGPTDTASTAAPAGGTVTGCLLSIQGTPGTQSNIDTNADQSAANNGASSPFGAGGATALNGGGIDRNGNAATGYGAGGGGSLDWVAAAQVMHAGGGAAGGYCEHWITSSIAGSYAFTVGAAGTAGTGTPTGAAGTQGMWIVEAY